MTKDRGVNIRIALACPSDTIVESLKRITVRACRDRKGPEPVFVGEGQPADLEWTLCAGIPDEGYRIETAPAGHIRIAAADTRGILYGMGRFLRCARFDNPGGKLSCDWRGTSSPRLPLRGMYFATHFHNFYQEAPIEQVQTYIEDLALQGYNALNVWFDMHHFTGMDDPAAATMLNRLRSMLATARETGMMAGIGVLANEGFRNTPAHLRATPTKTAHYGVEVCIRTPEGEDRVLSNLRSEFEAFRDVGLDFMWLWPYDQGGCACPSCAPWGVNGMLRIGEKISRMFRDIFPGGKVIYSTWLFDLFEDQGEWEGIANAFNPKPDWVDFLLADAHDRFPRFPLERGVPGNLPLLNFPEISMYGMQPWGGFGANPLLRRFASLWGEVAHLAQGGFPYSEGIFEDLNKAAYAGFYWTGQNGYRETLENYFRYEFGTDDVESCFRILDALEANHGPQWMNRSVTRKWGIPGNATPVSGYTDGTVRLPRPHASPERAKEAWDLCRQVESALPPWGRKSWRWRILALRCLLDHELLGNGDDPTEVAQDAFLELQDIYYARHAESAVGPPIRGVDRTDDSSQCDV